MDFRLTDEEKLTLLKIARDSITGRLSGSLAALPELTGALKEPCGAFVTLRKADALRGCIGYVAAAKPLGHTVREAALGSAFDDPRFPPLTRNEVGAVSIEISVLSPLVKASSPDQVEPGVHGVMMRRGFRSGLLLPQVAVEQGWDREQFLTHTCYKAGLPGDSWKSPDTTIEIFTAHVFGEKD